MSPKPQAAARNDQRHPDHQTALRVMNNATTQTFTGVLNRKAHILLDHIAAIEREVRALDDGGEIIAVMSEPYHNLLRSIYTEEYPLAKAIEESAKLVPVKRPEEFDEELLALAAAGQARLPQGKLPESFWETPAPKISAKKTMAALRADRDED